MWLLSLLLYCLGKLNFNVKDPSLLSMPLILRPVTVSQGRRPKALALRGAVIKIFSASEKIFHKGAGLIIFHLNLKG